MPLVPQTVKCFNCHQIKKEANHWWRIGIKSKSPYSITIMPFELVGIGKDIKGYTYEYACGESCLFIGIKMRLPGGFDESKSKSNP